MYRTYVYANHRSWLMNQPEQAIHCSQNASETGELLYEDGCLEEALPYLGSAYEISEILLCCQKVNFTTAVKKYTHTLDALIQALVKLGYIEESKQMYKAAIEHLKRKVVYNIDKNIVNKGLKHLRFEFDKLCEVAFTGNNCH